jgi:NTP pyrophosphatase (non-canonical NTP hydrolase)
VGSFKLTKENYKEVFKNAVTSMYNVNRCFVYNKKLVEIGGNKKENNEVNVFDLIRDWAQVRGLYNKGDSKTQYIKLMEEVGELAQGLLKEDRAEVQDAIGDIVVVLTNLAHLEQMRLEDCVTSAYDQIKDRKGSMNNGTFVKQETPKKPWGHQSVTL